jgi:hypothetical protein
MTVGQDGMRERQLRFMVCRIFWSFEQITPKAFDLSAQGSPLKRRTLGLLPPR